MINEANDDDQNTSHRESINEHQYNGSSRALGVSMHHNNMEHQDRPPEYVVKQELDYTSSTSPPPEESFFPMDHEDAMSRSTTPSVATSSSHEGTIDENGVLDLSMQRPTKTNTTLKLLRVSESSRTDIGDEPATDEHMRTDDTDVAVTPIAEHMEPHTFTSPALSTDDK